METQFPLALETQTCILQVHTMDGRARPLILDEPGLERVDRLLLLFFRQASESRARCFVDSFRGRFVRWLVVKFARKVETNLPINRRHRITVRAPGKRTFIIYDKYSRGMGHDNE